MEQVSTRFEYVFELGRLGMKSLIKDPVREAVREALAEERTRVEDETLRARRPDEERDTGSGNRLLRPRVLLPVLGLTAAGAILGRRWLMKAADVDGIVDRSDERSSSSRSSRRTAAGTDPTEVGSSTDQGGSSEAATGTHGSTGHGSSSEAASGTRGSTGEEGSSEDASQTPGSTDRGDDADETDPIGHRSYRDESDDVGDSSDHGEVGGVESEE